MFSTIISRNQIPLNRLLRYQTMKELKSLGFIYNDTQNTYKDDEERLGHERRALALAIHRARNFFVSFKEWSLACIQEAQSLYKNEISERNATGVVPTNKEIDQIRIKSLILYCEMINRITQPEIMKLQTIQVVNELRAISKRFTKKQNPFAVGYMPSVIPSDLDNDEDDADDMTDSKFILPNGYICSTNYLPHEEQILAMYTSNINPPESVNLHLSMLLSYYTALFDVVKMFKFLISFQPRVIDEDTTVETTIVKKSTLSQLSSKIKNLNIELQGLHEAEVNPEILPNFLWKKRKMMFYQTLSIFQYFKYQLIINKRDSKLKEFLYMEKFLFYTPLPLSLNDSSRKIGEWLSWKSALVADEPIKSSDYWSSIYCNNSPSEYPLYMYNNNVRNTRNSLLTFYMLYLKSMDKNDQIIFNNSVITISNYLDENLISNNIHEGNAPQQCIDLNTKYLVYILKIFNYFTLYYKDKNIVNLSLHKDITYLLIEKYTKRIKTEYAKDNNIKLDEDVEEDLFFDYKDILNYIIPKPNQAEIAEKVIKDILISQLYNNLLNKGNDLLSYYHTMLLDLKAKSKKGPITITNPVIDYIYKFYNDILHQGSIRETDGTEILSISKASLQQNISTLTQFINEQYYKQLETDKKHLQSTIEDFHTQLLEKEKEIEKKIVTIKGLEQTVVRNIETQVNDRCYSLLYELDGLKRQLKFFEKKMKFECDKTREETKKEFIDRIRDLEMELKAVNSEFDMYKENVNQTVKNKVSELKQSALVKAVEESAASLLMKNDLMERQNDLEKINNLEKENSELRKEIMRLKLMYDNKEVAARAAYDRELCKLNAKVLELESLLTEYGARDKREQSLEDRLIDLQDRLSYKEREVVSLKKQLASITSVKQQLEAHREDELRIITELRAKLRKYEGWDKMDVGKLVLDLEKQQQQLNQLNNVERKELIRRQMIQQAANRKINHMKNRLNAAENIKQQALQTIITFRKVQEVAPSTDPIIWAQNYAELLNTYEDTVHENIKLRGMLSDIGIDTTTVSSSAHPFKTPEEIGNSVARSPNANSSGNNSDHLPSVSPLYPFPPNKHKPSTLDANIIQQRNALRSVPKSSSETRKTENITNFGSKSGDGSFYVRKPVESPRMPILGTPIGRAKSNK